MKLAIALSTCLLGLSAADEPPLPPELFKYWLHSREEDTAGEKVYRPIGYKFPPARGRTGFEIKKNGEFLAYEIGPADGPLKVPGSWKAESKDKIVVTYAVGKAKPFTLRIVACDDKVLKIAK